MTATLHQLKPQEGLSESSEKMKIPVVRLCACFGCKGVAVARSLCATHYKRWKRHGSIEAGRPADWGTREKHPLYRYWCQLRRNSPARMGAWYDDFWAMAEAVGDRPSQKHMLVCIDTASPLGVGNVAWCESKAGEAKDASHAKHRDNQKSYMRDYQRDRAAADPFYAHKRSLRSYGLTLDDYEKMIVSQDHVCAICSRPESSIDVNTGRPYRLHIDHCHKTGEIRGLLCSHCNRALGHLDDDAGLLKRASRYLKNPPARAHNFTMKSENHRSRVRPRAPSIHSISKEP